MKNKLIFIFWGVMLILVSGLLVIEAFGYLSFDLVTAQDWAIVFAGASAAFTLTYFLSGVKQWGWLFPALLFAASSWNSFRTGLLFDPIHLAWPILAALGIPFCVGFALDRKRWGLLISAYVLIATALLQISEEAVRGLILGGGANDTSLAILMAGAGPLFLFALPFFVVYFWSSKNWWALLPAGAFTSVGLMSGLSILVPNQQNALTGVYNATLLLGFAVILGVLWLRRATQPTGWAKYPAAGFAILAVAALILGKGWGDLAQDSKAWIFAAGSAGFFVAYFLHGTKKWGWLFPACGCAGLCLTVWINDSGMDGTISAVPLFAGLALPFLAGFAVDRKRWGLLIPATFLTAFTIFLLVADAVQDEWSGVAFLFLFAMSFFVTYFWSKKTWWALIPAGSFASFGAAVLVEILIPHQEYPSLPNTLEWDAMSWVVFLGLAATFGSLWLLRRTQPTEWAMYPAAGLLAMALLSIVMGSRFQEFWAAAGMLVIGATLLLAALIKKLPASGGQTTRLKT